jgi:predicted metal-binding protein
VSLLQERFSQLIEAEVDRRLEAEAALRAERERQQRELLLLEKEQVQKGFILARGFCSGGCVKSFLCLN